VKALTIKSVSFRNPAYIVRGMEDTMTPLSVTAWRTVTFMRKLKARAKSQHLNGTWRPVLHMRVLEGNFS